MAVVTGFTASRMLAIENGTIVSGTVDDNGDLILTKKDNTTVNAGNVYDVLGYHIVGGDTPPASPSDPDGRPYLWVSNGSALTPVPTTPTAPTFNLATYTVTPPTITGVQYEFYDSTSSTWTPLTSGVATNLSGFTRPFLARVRAVAKPGYILTSNYEWNALFYTESALTLYSSDDFAGTANLRVAQANGSTTGQRAFNMGLGGSASGGGITKWWCFHPTEPSGLMIDSTGTKLTKNTEAGVANLTQGTAWYNIDTANCRIEFEVTAFAVAHGRSIGGRMASTNSAITNGAPWLIYINSSQAEVRLDALAGMTGTDTYVFKTSVAEANLLGVWKVSWINKILRVDAPDGQSFTRDYNATSFVFGSYNSLTLVGASGGPYPIIDNLKLYR